MLFFPVAASGGTLIDSGYDLSYIKDIKYYGRYFMFMVTPKVPNTYLVNTSDTGDAPLTNDASVTIKWDGVGDSDRLEIDYLPTTGSSATDPYTGYSAIPSSAWTTDGFTLAVPARDGVGDDYIYTIQTSLEPDTYYWYRVKNYKSKVNTFGHNLEYFKTTEPEIFKTGGFSDGGAREGEVSEVAEAPEGGGGGGNRFPSQLN